MSLKVAVTGSSGFIGSYFVKNNGDFEITEIDLLTTKIESLNFQGFDSVLHLAGIAHKRIKNEQLYYAINRDLAFQVAQKAKESGVKQFIFMSTAKVYGEFSLENQYFNEETECFPKDAYAKSKLEGESLIRSLENEQFKVAVVRSPMVYGPGVKANMYSLMKLVYKLPVLPFGGIQNKRAMVYLGNLNQFLKSIILQKSSGTFIPADDHNLSTIELCTLIADGLNKKPKVVKLPNILLRFIELIKPSFYYKIFGSFALENKQTLKILGINPPFSSKHGIQEMTTWFTQHIR